MASADRGKLDTELEGLDLPTLKKRRASARLSATRCENFLREQNSYDVKDLDLKIVTSHLEKFQQDIILLDALHDAIMNKLNQEGETEELAYTIDSAKKTQVTHSLNSLKQFVYIVIAKLSGSR